MKTLFKRPLIYLTLPLLAMSPTCLNAGEAKQVAEKADINQMSIDLEKGQMLTIASPVNKAGGEAALREYYQKAFTLAAKFGMKPGGALSTDQVVIGDYRPSGFSFFSFPDAKSEAQLYNQPQWPAIKALRPMAWDELRLYSVELQDDLNLNFRSDKSYTLVVAWKNPDNPDDYDRYLDGIKPAMEAAGGRFIYKMRAPRMESHASTLGAPDQLTFVEWEGTDGFAKVQKSETYRKAAPYFTSGVRKVEFYRMSLPTQTLKQ